MTPEKLKLLYPMVLALFQLPAVESAPGATEIRQTEDLLTVSVGDFGAIPNDGVCDAREIRAAVDSVSKMSNVRLVFDAGVYNLKESSVAERKKRLAMVHLWGLDDWVLEGAVDANGDPATTLEMNLGLRNEVPGSRHLDVRDCRRFTAKNFIIDQNPRMATAAKVLDVDQHSGHIKIGVLEGMPHFDGMASFSANNWDLATGLLIPGAPVSIGTDARKFLKWSAVVDLPGIYTMTNKDMADLLSEGQGISFHFNLVVPQGRSIDAYSSEDVAFENIFVYNAIGMILGAGDNRNMTFRRFHIKPEGNSLAVGPRDGIHMSRNTGRLLMDDVIVRGVRWDPIVSYKRFSQVAERIDDKSIRLSRSASLLEKALRVGSQVHFWSGETPSVRVVSELSGGLIHFNDALDPSVEEGTFITPGEWHWEEAIIRNSRIESNYGTAIVYQCDNLLVEHCFFNNNAYTNIGLGPTSSNAGMYARNIVIRNNTFLSSTWEPKYARSHLRKHRGTITTFNANPLFSLQQYHRNILIEDNLFKDLTGVNKPAAVDIKLAEDVIVRNNRYKNVSSANYVNSATTARVEVE